METNNPQPLSSIATPVSDVGLLPNAILDWRYHRGVSISLADAKHESELIAGLMEAHQLTHCRLLIDIRLMRSISREARQHFASQEIHDTHGVQALALHVDSPLSRMVGNLYMSFNHTLHPTRLFTEREAALTWLLSQ